jgi:hypothetical protein
VYEPDEELDSQVYQFDVSKGKIFAVSPHDVSSSLLVKFAYFCCSRAKI